MSVKKASPLTNGQITTFSRLGSGNELTEKLLDWYQPDCIDIFRLDSVRFDELAGCFDGFPDEREEIVRQLSHLLEEAIGDLRDPSPIIDKITQKLQSDLFNNKSIDYSPAEMASSMGISVYYMLREFKRNVGKTMSEYKNELKVGLAKNLLLNTELRVGEIAGKLGLGASYLTEIFKRHTSVTPLRYREIMSRSHGNIYGMTSASDDDYILEDRLEKVRIVSKNGIRDVSRSALGGGIITIPDAELGFLHEASVIAFGDVLFSAWYNCPRWEYKGRSLVRFSRSFDGGKSWSSPKIVADDPTGTILYSSPAFGIEDGKLRMFVNQMVAPDRIHSLDLYDWNEEKENFSFVRSFPIPFKLNSNVYALSNGKLLLSGRVGDPDGFPDTPAVLISDSGKLDGDWRVVRMQKDRFITERISFVHPEVSVAADGENLLAFTRNDESRIPIVFTSGDCGEHWSAACASDLAFTKSKICAGTLSDGRRYVIGNEQPDRKKLVAYFTGFDDPDFCERLVLRDGYSDALQMGMRWHYPIAAESNGRLYVVYTGDCDNRTRGLAYSVINLNKI